MSCTACAHNIETRLAQMKGVDMASVSFAARTVAVRFDPARTGQPQLVDAIEGLGYQVPLQSAPPSLDEESGALRKRFFAGAAFALPTLVLGMAEQFPAAQFALSLPVLAYSGLPFYQAAWKA